MVFCRSKCPNWLNLAFPETPVTFAPSVVVSNFFVPEKYKFTAPPLTQCIKLVLSSLSLKTISSSAKIFTSSASVLSIKSPVLLSRIVLEVSCEIVKSGVPSVFPIFNALVSGKNMPSFA